MDFFIQDEKDLEIEQKIKERQLKNAIVKTIRKNQVESFKIKAALIAITAAYAANAYSVTTTALKQHDKRQAMERITEEDSQILYDKHNRYEGLIDEQGYPRGWGYNHYNIGQILNSYYATSKDLGDIHLADIADIIEYDENNQNIDKVFNWVDDQYVGDAKNFEEYYQGLGFQTEEEFYQAMVDLNYELSKQENLGGPTR